MATAGRALLAAVDHIWVLTLPDTPRYAYMRSLLEQELQIPASSITYQSGASCSEWGSWPRLEWLQRFRQQQGLSTSQQSWWLAPRVCADSDEGQGGAERPPCLQRRYASCLATPANQSTPAVCTQLCYTLSVVTACVSFLASNYKRALLLEDDVCATTALRLPSSLAALAWLGANAARWDLVKLGDCYRPGRRVVRGSGGGGRGRHHSLGMSRSEALSSGTCAAAAAGGGELRLPNNSILMRLPFAMCSHALALSRRAASHLAAQAFPLSDVFDNMLISHFARQQGWSGLRMRSFDQSLFAQVAKVTPHQMVPLALRSQSRIEGM